MTALLLVGDVHERQTELIAAGEKFDLIITSPPFLALRSYLPDDHPQKHLEIGSEATPAEYLDVLLALTAEWRQLLAPHGSLAIELGDTYAGSGGGGGDYLPGGWRENEPGFGGSSERAREGNAAHWRQKNAWKKAGDYNPTGLRDGQQRFDGSKAADGKGQPKEAGPNPNDADASPLIGETTLSRPIPEFQGNTTRNQDGYRSFGGGKRNRNGSQAGAGWPLPQSLCGIPTLYTWSLAYGRNLLTGQKSPAGRWMIRNLKPWIRTNPPVGALGKKERPATSYITVATLARDRWFDLDAVRTPATQDPATYTGNGYTKGSPQGVKGNEAMAGNPGGAPPLDWWHPIDALIDNELQQRAGKVLSSNPPGNEFSKQGTGRNDGGKARMTEGGSSVGARGWHIRRALQAAGILPPHPDALDISPRGYSGTTPTTRLVPCGPHDGGQRTTSRGCPVHGDRPAPPRKVPDDARAGSPATRTPHTGGRHAQEQLDGFGATGPLPEPPTAEPSSDSLPQQCALAAIPHGTELSRTDPAPPTNPPDTPSAETTGRTAHTSTSPLSDAPNPDTPLSRTGEDGQPSPESEMLGRTADTSDPLAACTCSYHKAVKDTESTSHYAVWPPELVQQLVDEMCPRKVCTVCGVPSKRIVATERDTTMRPGRSGHDTATKPGNGLTASHGETNRMTLGWSDCGCEPPTTETTCTSTKCDSPAAANAGTQSQYIRSMGHSSTAQTTDPSTLEANRSANLESPGNTSTTDHWRPGRILDPFSGSGTTLAVATGMGRDAVGIDLDPRNAHLTEQRCGMFLEIDWGHLEPASELPPDDVVAAALNPMEGP